LQVLPVDRIEQRLFAEAVARDEQPAAGSIPDREDIHALESVDEVDPVLLVQVDENFGVRSRGERVPGGQQPAPQGREVVDLAVQHRPDGAVFVREWLVTALNVDDAEAAGAESEVGPSIYVEALGEGTPVR